VLSGSLTFSEGTKEIGYSSSIFSGGTNININKLILPSSLEMIKSESFHAYGGTVTTPTLNLPKKLTSIGGNAFYSVKTQLIVGNYDTDDFDNISNVSNSAFSYLESIGGTENKGYIINIGSATDSAFFTWLKNHGLSDSYFTSLSTA
jgi:hypothetical protein